MPLPTVSNDLLRSPGLFGTSLDRMHPSTREMRLCLVFNENAGAGAVDYVFNQKISTVVGSLVYKPSPRGSSFDCGAGVNNFEITRTGPNKFADPTAPITIYAIVNPGPTLPANQTVFSLGMKADSNSSYAFGTNNSGITAFGAGNGIAGAVEDHVG